MDLDLKILGENIRQARKELKLTQKQLANKVNVSTVYINQIENAKRCPSTETIYNISIALNKSIDTLINGNLKNDTLDDIYGLINLISKCNKEQRKFIISITKLIIMKLAKHK